MLEPLHDTLGSPVPALADQLVIKSRLADGPPPRAEVGQGCRHQLGVDGLHAMARQVVTLFGVPAHLLNYQLGPIKA
jgi:hypothetical protein